MNETKHINHGKKDTPGPLPASLPQLERLPVRFAADFPVEFAIQRLVDVPLRAEPRKANSVQPTC